MGESVEAAAIRESMKKTGLSANTINPYGVYSGPEQYHVYPDGNEAFIIDIVYTCDDFSGEITKQEGEVEDLEWFKMDQLPTNLSPPIKSALNEFCNERLALNKNPIS
jgi:NADH pyrophosphatase NudC (nudix superfamily)